jgi:hypothetical protein
MSNTRLLDAGEAPASLFSHDATASLAALTAFAATAVGTRAARTCAQFVPAKKLVGKPDRGVRAADRRFSRVALVPQPFPSPTSVPASSSCTGLAVTVLL